MRKKTLGSRRAEPFSLRQLQTQGHHRGILTAFQLGTQSHDVAHPPDTARLTRMGQVQADALQAGVRLEESLESF